MASIIHSVYFSDDLSKTPSHHHDCHQILLITEGEAEITVNNASQTVKSGNLVIFSRYENHSVRVLSKKYKRFVLRINPMSENNTNPMYSLLSNRPEGFENVINIAKFPEFESLFYKILEEHNSSHHLKEDMELLLINQLLIMIFRILPEKEIYFEKRSFGIASTLQRDFETNYNKDFSLKELAKQYNMSASSLSHQFKKVTGISVMDYLLSCRIAAAKNMLAKTDKSISEIVESCGFSDNSNFSRTFKKLNNMSPSEFRTKFKN